MPDPFQMYSGLGQGGSMSQGQNQGQSQSSSAPGMIPGMMGVYGQLLGLNQQHYQNVLGAYGGAQGNLASGLPSIYQGYGDIQKGVLNTLGMGQVLGQDGNWGVASPAAQAIQNSFRQTQGRTTQDMASAGLGNTTVGANLQNQNALMASQAYGNLGSQLAQTAAGYESQLGLAGLGARMQGLGMQTNLAQAAFGPLGQQMSNTAGPLSGGFSQSMSNQFGSSAGASRPGPYGGGGYGGSGGGSNQGITGFGGGGSGGNMGGGDMGGYPMPGGNYGDYSGMSGYPGSGGGGYGGGYDPGGTGGSYYGGGSFGSPSDGGDFGGGSGSGFFNQQDQQALQDAMNSPNAASLEQNGWRPDVRNGVVYWKQGNAGQPAVRSM